MPEISIIFVNYNTSSVLCDSIDSVFAKTQNLTFEIIVVDNNSNEDITQILSQKYGTKVQCECLNENIGFGRANNHGIKLATGKYIFLLNPDTILINNAIKILSDYLDMNPNAGVVGGNLYYSNMMPAASYEIKLPSIRTLLLGNWSKNRCFNATDTPIEVGYITGADMMIRSSVLTKTGFFDSDFFMYAEEVELTYRIHKAGYKSFSVPQAKIIHLEGTSFEFSNKRMGMQFHGRKLYFAKCYGRKGEIIFLWYSRLYAISRIMAFSILCNNKKVAYWKNRLSVIKM